MEKKLTSRIDNKYEEARKHVTEIKEFYQHLMVYCLVIPFLIFGAALKSWAFIVGLYLYFIKRIGLKMFIEFGVSNGIVAALFWLLIQYHS